MTDPTISPIAPAASRTTTLHDPEGVTLGDLYAECRRALDSGADPAAPIVASVKTGERTPQGRVVAVQLPMGREPRRATKYPIPVEPGGLGFADIFASVASPTRSTAPGGSATIAPGGIVEQPAPRNPFADGDDGAATTP